MKCLFSLFAALLFGGLLIAAPVSLPLKDGSVIKGEITSVTAADVVVSTEFGVARIPLDKLTEDGKKAAGVGKPQTLDQCQARIVLLEAKIKALEDENAQLRRNASKSAEAALPSTVRPQSATLRTADQPASGVLSYSLSSTGKRHNSRCRFYGGGKPCGVTDGVACKICGG